MSDVTPLPPDYHRRLAEAEDAHWWHAAMRELARTLLGARFDSSRRLLDAGCGAGGFLRWALDERRFEHAAGADVSARAVELARGRVPEADIRVASVAELPYEPDTFDLVVCQDVLQHIAEPDLAPSLAELRRVLEPSGTLLVRTNGSRRGRRERNDWRVFDRRMLAATLADAGFRCDRVTYVNVVGSALAAARGRVPRAPTGTSHGIPSPGNGASPRLAIALARLERRLLAHPGRTLPWGHTLIAVAMPST